MLRPQALFPDAQRALGELLGLRILALFFVQDRQSVERRRAEALAEKLLSLGINPDEL